MNHQQRLLQSGVDKTHSLAGVRRTQTPPQGGTSRRKSAGGAGGEEYGWEEVPKGWLNLKNGEKGVTMIQRTPTGVYWLGTIAK